MLEIFGLNLFYSLALAIALSGSLIAGIWDLFTTEIPDEIPYFMSTFGIFLWFIYMLTRGSTIEFISSLFVGTVFLIYGYVLYKSGQWGGGDGALLTSIGYLLPMVSGIEMFPLHFFINLYLAGAFWIFIYSIFVGIRNEKVRKKVKENFYKNRRTKLATVFIVIFLILTIYDRSMLFASAFFALILFYDYAKLVENYAFKRKIPISELKVGDVLANSKLWVGLSGEEVKRIKRTRKYVEIKEGVRFGLAFFFALLITLIFKGSPILNFYLSFLI